MTLYTYDLPYSYFSELISFSVYFLGTSDSLISADSDVATPEDYLDFFLSRALEYADSLSCEASFFYTHPWIYRFSNGRKLYAVKYVVLDTGMTRVCLFALKP